MNEAPCRFKSPREFSRAWRKNPLPRCSHLLALGPPNRRQGKERRGGSGSATAASDLLLIELDGGCNGCRATCETR